MTGMPKRNRRNQDEAFDNVDIFLQDKLSNYNTTICTNRHRPTQMAEEWRKLDYWDSGEAMLLFNPIPGKSVKQCLCDRDRLLQDIIEDARKVPTIIENGDADKTPLNSRQQQQIVTQCLYLRMAFKNAIQYMNAWTWHIRVVKRQLNRSATWEYHTSAMKKRYDAGIYSFEIMRPSQTHEGILRTSCKSLKCSTFSQK
jgi:hypothetical protein